MTPSLVVMGVAGCGKSTLAAAVALDQHMELLEGDSLHSQASRDKMSRGVALTDADRQGWLATLADALRARPQGLVVTCSALRRSYRDRLRQPVPGLRFVFLDISREVALQRVAARPGHFFSASLVDSQFATLESPLGEAGVLRVDATAPMDQLRVEVTHWLRAGAA